jgi:hypothetical protein
MKCIQRCLGVLATLNGALLALYRPAGPRRPARARPRCARSGRTAERDGHQHDHDRAGHYERLLDGHERAVEVELSLRATCWIPRGRKTSARLPRIPRQPSEIHCHAELSASGPAMGECRLRGVRCT